MAGEQEQETHRVTGQRGTERSLEVRWGFHADEHDGTCDTSTASVRDDGLRQQTGVVRR